MGTGEATPSSHYFTMAIQVWNFVGNLYLQ
jgi:hypothetical protein